VGFKGKENQPRDSAIAADRFIHALGLNRECAVVIVGFAGALDALGNLTSADFIALVAPLGALLAVIVVARGTADAGSRPGSGKDSAGPGL